jgi:DNA-binding SARP family transcriptional activator
MAEATHSRRRSGGPATGVQPGLPDLGLTRVALLGPVEIALADGDLIHLEAGRQTALMVVLSLRAGAAVSATELVDAVWDSPRPQRATQQLHTYMSRLRRALQPESVRWHRNGLLSTTNGSYTLSLSPQVVDVIVFEDLAARAGAARMRGDLRVAGDLFDAALGYWRGQPFAGLPGPLLDRERFRLTERWLWTRQEKLALELQVGGHHAVISELQALVAEHPFREHLVELLMLAFYRAGRQSDALRLYAATRTRLDDELGIEPGASLQELYVRILRAEDSLLYDATSTGSPVARDVVVIDTQSEPGLYDPLGPPAQLPRDNPDFTGRTAESADLARQLSPRAGGPSVPVTVIAGRPGVGKTTLAVHVAHLVRDVFTDGQIYLNLRGTDPNPVEPAEALDILLRSVHVPPAMVPDSVNERAALFRTTVAGRRILIVADDAHTAQQVRSLLPGGPACAVLITSRTPLAGLDGAHHVHLDSFDDQCGLQLLRRIVGGAAIDADAAAAAEIVKACAGLPLAINLAAGKLTEYPGWPLRHLATLLRDEDRRLDTLTIADEGVRCRIAPTVQRLTREQRHAFTSLSRCDAPFDTTTATAALGVSAARAAQLIDALVACQMLDIAGHRPGGEVTMRFHDLIRIYARELATTRWGTPPAVDAYAPADNERPRRRAV